MFFSALLMFFQTLNRLALIPGRQQMLLEDEISCYSPIMGIQNWSSGGDHSVVVNEKQMSSLTDLRHAICDIM